MSIAIVTEYNWISADRKNSGRICFWFLMDRTDVIKNMWMVALMLQWDPFLIFIPNIPLFATLPHFK